MPEEEYGTEVEMEDSDEHFTSNDAFQNIKNLIDKMKTTVLDYNNFETEYRSLYTANQFLNHNLQTLFVELKRHEKEEEVILSSMEKVGALQQEGVSSEAWKPLAEIRGKIKITLNNIKDLTILKDTCNFMAVSKFKLLIDVNKGLILSKEMAANQLAVSKQMNEQQAIANEMQMNHLNKIQIRYADVFERSLGNLVAKFGDIGTERIKEMREKYTTIKAEIVKKENELAIALRETDKNSSKIEYLEEEVKRLRGGTSFTKGVLEIADPKGSETAEKKQPIQPEQTGQEEALSERLRTNEPPNNNSTIFVSDDEVNKFKTVARRVLGRCGKAEAFQTAYNRYKTHANGRPIMLDALEDVAKPLREEKGFD